MMSTLQWSAQSQQAMRDAALSVLTAHVAKNASMVIATHRGSAEPEIETLLAAGWTLEDREDRVAGKRIRYITPPPGSPMAKLLHDRRWKRDK